MQTKLGFWIFQRRSSLIGGYPVFYCDNGFGDLIPCQLPVHMINSLEF